MPPRSHSRRSWLACLLLVLMAACAKDVTDFQALRLVIGSEPPLQPGATIAALQLALRSPDGKTLKLPLPGKEADLTFALPAGRNIVTTPYTIDVAQPAGSAGLVQVRVLGVGKQQVLTAWTGVVDTRTTGELAVTLRAPQAACDADGDGVADCKKPGCCATADVPSDCNDDGTPGKDGIAKGFACSPFNTENACTQCGNGLDEDCDGTDTACVDSDSDGVPDCQETACPPGATTDPGIHPGAVEVCDGKDNDCDLLVDDGLATADDPSPTHKAGDACGVGACAGGVWQCDPTGAQKPMVCSTNAKKAAQEDCSNNIDDDCDGKTNQGCALLDLDGDGVNNDVEKAKCAYKFAMYHAEFYPPDAPEKCCLASVTDTTLCDTNCDGKTTPCDPTDKDGDGWPAKKDCDDNDPLTYFGAPEKCGDGKLQSCQGSDPPCDASDKDGDGWLAPADCDDADAAISPEGKEICNGRDDNCNGITDDGNPEGGDAQCGSGLGECGHVGDAYGQITGVSVCKHYKLGQTPTDPLDCTSPYAAKSGTCVGCEGDNRPKPEICNGLDDDCNGKTDEPFNYTQENGNKQGIGMACDGVGACGIGVVECIGAGGAGCSSDPNGSAPQNSAETCNDLDDNCNGQTDENLTVISDSTCQKAGVCGAALAKIQTVCTAGVWICDYSQVPNVQISSAASAVCKPGDPACACVGSPPLCQKLQELSCDGLDNDCDGNIDEDFGFIDFDGVTPRTIGQSCLTGACSGGTVICAADKKSVTCSSLAQVKAEQCNGLDDNCNGKTDEASDLPVEKSSCKQVGVCAVQKPVATCTDGAWLCDYSQILGWESPGEASCDGLDNDCNGMTDDGCDDDGDGFCDGALIWTAAAGTTCAKTTSAALLDCDDSQASTAPGQPERCNNVDDDCNGDTDEGCDSDKDGYCDAGMQWANAPTVCPLSTSATVLDCDDTAKAVHPGAIELCNGSDDNCNGATDEGCDDDGDGYCDAAMARTGTPQVCLSGGGDCDDEAAAIHPSAVEICDGVDDNCDGQTDEGVLLTFFADADGDGYGRADGAVLACAAPAGAALVAGDCDDGDKAIHPGAAETCNGRDDNCDGATDEGVTTTFYADGDGDGYGLASAPTQACSAPGGYVDNAADCDDAAVKVHPGAVEACNGVDDNCDGVTDGMDAQGCAPYFVDADGDGFGPSGGATVCLCAATPDHPVQLGGDCDDSDKARNPGATELCNGIDDNCNGLTDDGVGAGALCTQKNAYGSCSGVLVCLGAAGWMCDGPSAQVEICDGQDQDCDGLTDEDNPGGGVACTTGLSGVCGPGSTLCSGGTLSCKSTVASSPEVCNGLDDNCDGATDNNTTDSAQACSTGLYGVCGAGTTECVDAAIDCTSTTAPRAELCNGLDDNCDGATDEGCPE